MNEYLERIKTAESLDELDSIVEEASFDDSLTNSEYEEIYVAGLSKAQSWNI